MLEPNKTLVKVMYELTSAFFFYRVYWMVFLATDALLDFKPSLHKILI